VAPRVQVRYLSRPSSVWAHLITDTDTDTSDPTVCALNAPREATFTGANASTYTVRKAGYIGNILPLRLPAPEPYDPGAFKVLLVLTGGFNREGTDQPHSACALFTPLNGWNIAVGGGNN